MKENVDPLILSQIFKLKTQRRIELDYEKNDIINEHKKKIKNMINIKDKILSNLEEV